MIVYDTIPKNRSSHVLLEHNLRSLVFSKKPKREGEPRVCRVGPLKYSKDILKHPLFKKNQSLID